jgi:cystathionine beta-lyase family protein involved in aluminum resistance
LVENDFDYNKIKSYLQDNKVKLIEIQRSKGYSTRKGISLDKIDKVTKLIKEVSPETIIMVDNCYCEFVNKKEVTEVGVDIACGSLIKNLGAGIASNGGYIVGRKDLIKLCAERLTLPGEGKEVGPTQGTNRDILKGLFLAPSVVRNALKTAILTAKVMESYGYEVEPKYNDNRVDIVQNIIFHDKDKLIKYCQGIQKGSPIDSNVVPVPSYMPGYEDDVIMASGSFTQGSSIELSCDGPLREPYIAYQQGSLTYEYGKLGLISALQELDNE